MKGKEALNTVTHLMCREIQAPLVSALIKGFEQEFGEEMARSVAEKVIDRDAANFGTRMKERFQGNDLKVLAQIVNEVWAVDGTMDIENLNLDGESMSLTFDVTRCGYAELYEKLGIKSLGTLLSCRRDFAFTDGFNPGIELIRTKTIMEGERICDFCYRIKPV